MQSRCVDIRNGADVGLFVSLFFCLDDLVLNNLLALLLQSNKLNAAAGEGCKRKNDTK